MKNLSISVLHILFFVFFVFFSYFAYVLDLKGLNAQKVARKACLIPFFAKKIRTQKIFTLLLSYNET